MTTEKLIKELKNELDYILIKNEITLKESTKKYYLKSFLDDITTYFKVSKIESIFIKYNEKVIHNDIIDNELLIEHKIEIKINYGFIKIDTYFLE